MSSTNVEVWYYLQRATPATSVYEVDDLLSTMPIANTQNVRSVGMTIGGTAYTLIPISALSYTLLFATKVYAVTSGTLKLDIMCTSATGVTLYLQTSQNSTVNTYTLSGSAGSIRSISLNLTANVMYTLTFTYDNDTITPNNTVWIQSSYTGIRSGKHNAWAGGAGTTLKLSSSSVIAVGDYKFSARNADFDGWLLCDGRTVNRIAYAGLFAIIEDKFGSGDGSTTFNLPDLRGRVPGSIGSGPGLSSRVLGYKTGTENHTLTVSEIPGHDHTGTTSQNGAHSHIYHDAYFAENGGNKPTGTGFFGNGSPTDIDNGFFYRTASGSSQASPANLNTSQEANHTHSFTTSSIGGGGAHNIMQPTLFIGNFFICAEV